MEEEKRPSFENIASGTAVVAPFLSGPSLGLAPGQFFSSIAMLMH